MRHSQEADLAVALGSTQLDATRAPCMPIRREARAADADRDTAPQPSAHRWHQAVSHRARVRRHGTSTSASSAAASGCHFGCHLDCGLACATLDTYGLVCVADPRRHPTVSTVQHGQARTLARFARSSHTRPFTASLAHTRAHMHAAGWTCSGTFDVDRRVTTRCKFTAPPEAIERTFWRMPAELATECNAL